MTQNKPKSPLKQTRRAIRPEAAASEPAPGAKPRLSDILGTAGIATEPAPFEPWVPFEDQADESDAAEPGDAANADDAAFETSRIVLPVAATPWQALVNRAISQIEQNRSYAIDKLLNVPKLASKEPPLVPLASTLTAEEIEAKIAALRDPFACRAGAATCRPAVMLNVAALLALVSLARSIGSEARRAEITSPGHLTLVEGAAKQAMDYLGRLVEWGLCSADTPKDTVVAFDLELRTNRSTALPTTAETEIQAGKPVVLIAGPGFTISPGVAATIDTRLTLGVLTTDALVYLLRLSHSTTGDIAEAAVRALLPPDPVLASFTGEEILMALRKPTAVAVAQHLAALAAKRFKPAGRFAEYPMSPELRAKAKRLIDDIRAFRAGERDWKDCLSGILLYGPPGVGKTDFARMIAGEAGMDLFEASPAKIIATEHLGHSLRLLHEIFAKAEQVAPALICIDEIDGFGSREVQDKNSTYRNALNGGVLAALNGLKGRPGVWVIGATNYPGLVDPALIRAGRFDTRLRIDLPEPELIVPIFRWHLDGDLRDVDLTPLISVAAGRSHADIACAVRDARAAARAEGRDIDIADLNCALAPGKAMPSDVRARVAIHEAGHAVARYALTGQVPERMMITPDGGHVADRPGTAPLLVEDYRKEIVILLAGRAAESVLLGQASAGSGGNATSDLAKATALAATLETSLGLGDSGLLWLGPPESASSMVRTDPDLGDHVTAHLNDAEARARRLIERERKKVVALAKALNHRGYLGKVEIEGVVP